MGTPARSATLSAAGAANNDLTASEMTLSDLTERMLADVATRFGKNSAEYE
jgi:hypothetical protein